MDIVDGDGRFFGRLGRDPDRQQGCVEPSAGLCRSAVDGDSGGHLQTAEGGNHRTEAQISHTTVWPIGPMLQQQPVSSFETPQTCQLTLNAQALWF